MGKRSLRSDAQPGATSLAKRARVGADAWGDCETSPFLTRDYGRLAEPMHECSPSIQPVVIAGTNSVTSDDPGPELLAATAETCFSSESEHDGFVEGVGERNPSQIEELKWLKSRLRKLMAQQAKLVQRRTALRKVCGCPMTRIAETCSQSRRHATSAYALLCHSPCHASTWPDGCANILPPRVITASLSTLLNDGGRAGRCDTALRRSCPPQTHAHLSYHCSVQTSPLHLEVGFCLPTASSVMLLHCIPQPHMCCYMKPHRPGLSCTSRYCMCSSSRYKA